MSSIEFLTFVIAGILILLLVILILAVFRILAIFKEFKNILKSVEFLKRILRRG